MNIDSEILLDRLHDMMRDAAILGAMASDAMHGRVADDISENEAFRLYGRRWIEDRQRRGQIHFSRIGEGSKSRKCYSRFEIESLKRSEKYITDAFRCATINSNT